MKRLFSFHMRTKLNRIIYLLFSIILVFVLLFNSGAAYAAAITSNVNEALPETKNNIKTEYGVYTDDESADTEVHLYVDEVTVNKSSESPNTGEIKHLWISAFSFFFGISILSILIKRKEITI